MKYLEFYGLQREPFRNEPDRRFYFESRAQAAARLRVVRGLQQQKGLCLLIGAAGAGKTTLARHVLEGLAPSQFLARLLVIAHGSVDSGWLLRRIASAFGVAQPRPEPLHVLGQIYEQLVNVQKAGQHAVLILDEAQMLRERFLMEEFRSLLNLEYQGRKLLSLVLCGMEELDEAVRLDPALGQRVDIRSELRGLDSDEVAQYLAHRIRCVRGSPDILSDEAVKTIAAYSEGTPRLINTIADNALFEGYLGKSNPVDAKGVEVVVEQLGLGASRPVTSRGGAVHERADGQDEESGISGLIDPFEDRGLDLDVHAADANVSEPDPFSRSLEERPRRAEGRTPVFESPPVTPPTPAPETSSPSFIDSLRAEEPRFEEEPSKEEEKKESEASSDDDFGEDFDVDLEDSEADAPAAEESLEEAPSNPVIADDSGMLAPAKVQVMITSDPPGTDKGSEAPKPAPAKSAETEEDIDSLFDGIQVGGEDGDED
jgi:type II secretory pathway predicted ATPase ExeA